MVLGSKSLKNIKQETNENGYKYICFLIIKMRFGLPSNNG
jgi:hypothetical protein